VSSDPYFIYISIANSPALNEYLEPSIGTKIFEKSLPILVRKLPIKFKLFYFKV